MRENVALFKYELAIVAIIKNEAPYIIEWLNYHLSAGIDHFYIYDNDSTDNVENLLKPYIDANIVDYVALPGKVAQMLAYNDAVDRHKFDCRYIAFIDADEFLLPRNNNSIKDVLHNTLDDNPGAAALTVNWHVFGPSGHDKADLSQGVLERFRYRTPNDFEVDKNLGNSHVKTIANPRCVDVMTIPHFAFYYHGKAAVDSDGNVVPGYCNPRVPDDKIIINHYQMKSREEYERKVMRGNADAAGNFYKMQSFHDVAQAANVYDDEILTYRQACYQLLANGERVSITIEPLDDMNKRRFDTLVQTLLPLTLNSTPKEQFAGKLHVFMTCRAVSHDLSGGGGQIPQLYSSSKNSRSNACIER